MSSKNIAVFLSGGGSNFKSILEKIDSINGKVVLAVSNLDAPGLDHARKRDIPTLISNDFKEIHNELTELEVDLAVFAGYLVIVPEWFTREYAGRIINIHPSLLPSFGGDGYYGERVHSAVLDYGVKVTGATTHFVNEVTDGGPIIMQRCVEVKDDDTLETLAARVLKVEHEMLPETIKLFCDDKLRITGNKVIIE